MKIKAFNLFRRAMLLLFLLAGAAQAQADDVVDYDLTISDVAVTNENCGDLSVIPGVSGTVKYDPTTNTLTLNNATIAQNTSEGVYFTCGIEVNNLNLTIKLIGKNTISASNATLIVDKNSKYFKTPQKITLTGGGTLVGDKEIGVISQYSHLVLDGVSAEVPFIRGYNEDTITVRNSTLRLSGSTSAAYTTFGNFNQINLEGCVIAKPAGGKFDYPNSTSTGLAFLDKNGDKYFGEAVIEPYKTYPVQIAGTQVSNTNCGDLSQIPGVSGTAAYDPDTKTLTLDNATISAAGSAAGLLNNANGIARIKLTGSNTITANANALEMMGISPTIEGGGTLTLKSNKAGIYLKGSALTLDSCSIELKGKNGILGDKNSTNSVRVSYADINATCDSAAISGLSAGLSLESREIYSPTDAAFDNSTKAVVDSKGQLVKNLIIKNVTYGLYVNGQMVNSENRWSLGSLDGVSGTMIYYPEQKKLYLNNVTIESTANACINNTSIDGLTINVAPGGASTLASKQRNAIKAAKPTTIAGSDMLSVESSTGSAILFNDSLTIKEISVTVMGKYGIYGNSGSQVLTIDKADVTAEGSAGSICNLASLTLKSCQIDQPTGAAFNATLGGVVKDGALVKEKVVINKYEDYGIQIAGVKVTNLNCNDLSVIPGVSGTVKYNTLRKTLTLENATIEYNAESGATGNGIKNESVDNLTIKVTGTNRVYSKSGSSLYQYNLGATATIEGDGTLNIEAEDGSGIYLRGNLVINNSTVNVKTTSNDYAIFATSGATNTLTVNNANVTIEGTNGALRYVDTLYIPNSQIKEPTDVTVGYAGANAIKYWAPAAAVTGKVVIEKNPVYDVVLEKDNGSVIQTAKKLAGISDLTSPQASMLVRQAPCVVLENLSESKADEICRELRAFGCETSYWLHGTWDFYLGFRINGVEVTKDNCDDLSVIDGVTGTVRYDQTTKTLTLDNATINTDKNSGIYVYYLKNLTINVTGENNIVTTNNDAIATARAMTITGSGTLNTTADKFSGIFVEVDDTTNVHLVIDGCTVNAKGKEAINGGGNGTLAIRNATVTAKGSRTSYVDFSSITLTGCEIISPQNFTLYKLINWITNDSIVIKKIEYYGLQIAGVEVTEKNYNDLRDITGVRGNVFYEPETKTLVLHDANIESDKAITTSSLDSLVIYVTGETNITTKSAAINVAYTPTIIKGDGVLNVTSSANASIYFMEALKIEDCTVNAKGVWGIVGDNGTQENLTIRKANVTAKGSNGSIIDIASLTLDSCIITAPEGAEYNETQHAVMLDETIVTDSVVIKPGVAILYDVVLESCTDDKAAATSLVQTVTGLGQTESEALVESVPCIILENVSLSEARKICMICTEANCTANYYPHGTWKPVGIKSVKIDTVPAHKQGIYSIDGVYLGNDFDALPKGIYIKDGKKVMK